MLSDAEFANLVHHFPQLADLDVRTRASFTSKAVAQAAPKGFAVFEAGQRCENFLWLTDGCVRVVAESENGRQILLYRVEPGQLCVFTTGCLLGHQRYPARGEVESSANAVFLPATDFETLVLESEPLRQLVFSALSTRMHELMGLVEAVAFEQVDRRLARALLHRETEADGFVHCTHQDLAEEVGTAREIVSRILADLERSQWVELGRGRLRVLDRDSLAQVAESGPRLQE